MNGRSLLDGLWTVPIPIVGMIHLLPLPGAPRWAGSMRDVVERARTDAAALAAGGVDGILVENFMDAPFYPAAVPPETTAAMAVAVAEVVASVDCPVGVNVLRNDAAAALGVASAAGARFIRVNVHTGAMIADQGWITGQAHDTLRRRERLDAPVAILADVLVKHATPPATIDRAQAARDTRERGLADGLIVSGAATGAPTDPERIRTVRDAVPDAPVWVGSGLSRDTAESLLSAADGAIVGSALQRHGRAGTGVVEERVAELMREVERIRTNASLA